MTINKATNVTTGEVRISYEHLMKAYTNDPKNEPKFSATLLIPKTDYATKQRIDAAIQAAIQEGITDKWGGVRPPQPPIPLWDGDGLRAGGDAFGPECKGCWVMTASSKQPVEIVDVGFNPIIQPTEVYSGMYARGNINFFAYNKNGKRGIGCGLGPVQKLRDGEPLGGYVSAAEAFGAPGAAVPTPQQYIPGPVPQQYPPAAPAPVIDPITGQVIG